MYGQVKTSKKTISLLKQIVKETKNKEKTQQDDMQRLEAVATLTCRSFTDEGITLEMFVEANVFKLGEVGENLCKKVTELKSKMTHDTHPKVLEEQRKASIEAVQKIEEAEVLYPKAVEQFSQSLQCRMYRLREYTMQMEDGAPLQRE